MSFIIEQLSTREWAVIFWLVMIIIWSFSKKDVRASFLNVLKCFFHKKIITPILLLAIYISLFVYLLSEFNLWDKTLLKDTIYWFLFVGFVLLLNSNTAINNKKDYFKKIITDNLKLLVLVGFIVNFYTFNFFIELIIVPLVAVIVLINVYSGIKKEYFQVKKITDYLLSLAGFLFIIYAFYKILFNYKTLIISHNLILLVLPAILSVALIPFLFLFILLMKHEKLIKGNLLLVGKIIYYSIATLTLIIAIFTLVETKKTVEIASDTLQVSREAIDVSQRSLEIASYPNISIKALSQEYSWIKPSDDSKYSFVVKNNFFGKISDIEINTEYLLVFPDKETRHITICPFGYAKNIDNKLLTLSGDIRVNNLEKQTFELEPMNEHFFNIDYSNGYEAMINETYKGAGKGEIRIVLKINIKYKKNIDNTTYNYSKYYRVFNKERLVDLQEDPTQIAYNDKKNEIEIDDQGRRVIIPSIIYPFKEVEFIKKIEEIYPPYDFTKSECKIFTLDKEETEIRY